MDTSANDRRRAARWPVQLLAKCTWETRDSRRETDALVMDVNDGGLRLTGSIDGEEDGPALRPGRPLSIRGFFYDERGDHAVTASVCWVRQQPDGSWAAGARFTEPEKGRARPSAFQDFLRVVRSETA